MRRLWIVAMLIMLSLGVSLVMWDRTGPYSEFCPLDGLLVEPPDGWDWWRDHNNDCAWTLFNDSGDRASSDLYAGTPIEPPPDYPEDWDEAGWALIIGSLVVLADNRLAGRTGEAG